MCPNQPKQKKNIRKRGTSTRMPSRITITIKNRNATKKTTGISVCENVPFVIIIRLFFIYFFFTKISCKMYVGKTIRNAFFSWVFCIQWGSIAGCIEHRTEHSVKVIWNRIHEWNQLLLLLHFNIYIWSLKRWSYMYWEQTTYCLHVYMYSIIHQTPETIQYCPQLISAFENWKFEQGNNVSINYYNERITNMVFVAPVQYNHSQSVETMRKHEGGCAARVNAKE